MRWIVISRLVHRSSILSQILEASDAEPFLAMRLLLLDMTAVQEVLNQEDFARTRSAYPAACIGCG